MNLLAIVGSPRKRKATDTLVDRAIEGAKSKFPNGNVKKLRLIDCEQLISLTQVTWLEGDMKKCPKCENMNSSYTDKCNYCGYDIKWLPDDGTENEATADLPASESILEDDVAHIEEVDSGLDGTGLDDIYSQLEDIKKKLSQGSTIFDVNMPFGRMVMLFIKVILAAIPAIMIVGFVFLIFWAFLGGLIFNLFYRGYWLQ